jgi:hypothetical protein
VRFIDVLYLIFEFPVALWQSFDYDIGAGRRLLGSRAHKKQVLADLEFVLGHNAHYTRAPFRPGDVGNPIRLSVSEQIRACGVYRTRGPAQRGVLLR